MATIQEINSTIISGTFTNDQLDSIAMAIKFARAQIVDQVKFTLVKGSKVKFTGRQGRTVIGIVDKVNRKYIHVREMTQNSLSGGIWRVPANMLEAA